MEVLLCSMTQAQIQGGKGYLKRAVPALVLMGLCLWLTHIFLDPTIPAWAYTHLHSSIGGRWYEAIKELGQAQVPLWLFFLIAVVGSRKRIAIEGFAASALMGVSVIVLSLFLGGFAPPTNSEPGMSRKSALGISDSIPFHPVTPPAPLRQPWYSRLCCRKPGNGSPIQLPLWWPFSAY